MVCTEIFKKIILKLKTSIAVASRAAASTAEVLYCTSTLSSDGFSLTLRYRIRWHIHRQIEIETPMNIPKIISTSYETVSQFILHVLIIHLDCIK